MHNADQPCWKTIGVWGESTCEKLTQVVHCYDCAVYTTVGAQLLQKVASLEYRAQQTAQFAIADSTRDRAQLFSVLIFRLGQEWLGLSAKLCQQILAPVAPHTLPHCSNATLLGLVNIRGQLLLKVSLLEILGLSSAAATTSASPFPNSSTFLNSSTNSSTCLNLSTITGQKVYPRMVVLEKTTETGGIDTWVFDVDELYGIYALAFDQLEAAASGASSVAEACTRYVFSWRDQRVNFLDDVRLFDALRQQAL